MLSTADARGWHLAVLVLIGSALTLAAAAYLDTLGWLSPLFSDIVRCLTTCPHRRITGAPCPLCGVTTAAVLLLNGDFVKSAAVHPLPLFAAPGVAVQTVFRLYRLSRPLFSLKQELLLLLICIGLGAIASATILVC